MKENTPDVYRRKNRSKSPTIQAKSEAHKIAFAPLSFQATKSMRDLGILDALYESGQNGLTVEEISKELKLSKYGVSTLLEVGSSLNIVNTLGSEHYCLSDIGDFILNDEMTKINMDFVNDVCYQGAFYLEESIKESKPVGLKVFGLWNTIYEGLTKLPEKVQKSWFAFDHYYSDISFPKSLPIVFSNNPKYIFDIGGNTGKWAIQCLKYNEEVKVKIIDLPGQVKKATESISKLGLESRFSSYETNILTSDPLPSGADTYWMSQFLDCFSKDEIVSILEKVADAADSNSYIYILEPLWDVQNFEAAKFSLNHTSLYFTCMANGNSKMYSFKEMKDCIEKAGLRIETAHHNLDENEYSLLQCRKIS